jgi:GNAT superfamily N-acetyltransferase
VAPVRPPVPADDDSLVAVATACDQTGVLSVCDARYLDHVRTSGQVLVSGDEGAVEGYAGVIERAGTAYLTDLFVHPDARDRGHGRALLAAAWDGRGSRATSSSQDPRALSGYARFGARPRWPLLYLRLPGGATPSAPVVVREHEQGDAGWRLGLDGLLTVAVLGGPAREAATAVVRRDGDRYRVLRAVTPDPRGLPVLVAELARRAGASGSVSLVVPGPHPALADVLAMGARVEELDLWCTTPDAVDLVDPEHELPSPALA